ncbi:MAG: hypothetical protein ACTSSI_07960 [Candidatus Helarchaeota archaeon]
MKKTLKVFIGIIIGTFIVNLMIVLINLIFFHKWFLYQIDADHYLSIAKTLYLDPSVWDDFSFGYFGHFFPYPFLVRLLFPFNLELGMIIISFVFYSLSLYVFLKIGKLKEISENVLSLLILIFAGVYNIYVIFGSSNGGISMLLFLSLLGYFFYSREQYLYSSIFFGLMAMTHVIGAMFCPLFWLLMLWKKKYWQSLYYLCFIPLFLSVNFFYFLWAITVVTGAFNPLYFLAFFFSSDITVRRFFPFGFFLGYPFMPIFADVYPFVPPFRFQLPDYIFYSTVFLIIFCYSVYVAVKQKQDLDFTFVTLGFFAFLVHWTWTQSAIRLLSIPMSVLLLNLNQDLQSLFDSKNKLKLGLLIGFCVGLCIQQYISYSYTIVALNLLDFLNII